MTLIELAVINILEDELMTPLYAYLLSWKDVLIDPGLLAAWWSHLDSRLVGTDSRVIDWKLRRVVANDVVMNPKTCQRATDDPWVALNNS